MTYTKCVTCFQDVEICVFELQKILNRVVMKSKIMNSSYPFHQADLCPLRSSLLLCLLHFQEVTSKPMGSAWPPAATWSICWMYPSMLNKPKAETETYLKRAAARLQAKDGSMPLRYWTDETTWLRQWRQEVMREHVWAVNGMTGWHENFRPKHAKQVFLTELSLDCSFKAGKHIFFTFIVGLKFLLKCSSMMFRQKENFYHSHQIELI